MIKGVSHFREKAKIIQLRNLSKVKVLKFGGNPRTVSSMLQQTDKFGQNEVTYVIPRCFLGLFSEAESLKRKGAWEANILPRWRRNKFRTILFLLWTVVMSFSVHV